MKCRHRVGDLAYWDSFSGGLVPCKVLQGADSDGEVIVELTADRGPYERGEWKRDKWYHVIPRQHAKVRKHGSTVVGCAQLETFRWNENEYKKTE